LTKANIEPQNKLFKGIDMGRYIADDEEPGLDHVDENFDMSNGMDMEEEMQFKLRSQTEVQKPSFCWNSDKKTEGKNNANDILLGAMEEENVANKKLLYDSVVLEETGGDVQDTNNAFILNKNINQEKQKMLFSSLISQKNQFKNQ
jgi:hypothetical protein